MNPNAFPGNELRERREALGFTVDEVFRKVRIPSQYLAALEESNFRNLPAASYTVGFLRSYCEFLELDASKYLDSFRACARPASGRFLGIRRNETQPMPQWVGETVAWCAICGIIALCWLSYSMLFQPRDDAAQGRVHAEQLELKLPATANGE